MYNDVHSLLIIVIICEYENSSEKENLNNYKDQYVEERLCIKLKDFFCDLIGDLCWRMFYAHLRRLYILLGLGGMFCICLLGPSDLQCCSHLLFPN